MVTILKKEANKKNQDKKRFHVSLSQEEQEILILLSQKDNVPMATKAAELLKESLELHEDEVLLERLEARKTKNIEWVEYDSVKNLFS